MATHAAELFEAQGALAIQAVPEQETTAKPSAQIVDIGSKWGVRAYLKSRVEDRTKADVEAADAHADEIRRAYRRPVNKLQMRQLFETNARVLHELGAIDPYTTEIRITGQPALVHSCFLPFSMTVETSGETKEERYLEDVLYIDRLDTIFTQKGVEVSRLPAGIAFGKHCLERIYDRHGCSQDNFSAIMSHEISSAMTCLALSSLAQVGMSFGTAKRPHEYHAIPFADGLLKLDSRLFFGGPSGRLGSRTVLKAGKFQPRAPQFNPIHTRIFQRGDRSYHAARVFTGITFLSGRLLGPAKAAYSDRFEQIIRSYDLSRYTTAYFEPTFVRAIGSHDLAIPAGLQADLDDLRALGAEGVFSGHDHLPSCRPVQNRFLK